MELINLNGKPGAIIKDRVGKWIVTADGRIPYPKAREILCLVPLTFWGPGRVKMFVTPRD